MLGGCRSSAPIPEQGSRLSSVWPLPAWPCSRLSQPGSPGALLAGSLLLASAGTKALDTQLVGLQHPAFIQELQETDLDRMVRLSLTALSI